MRYLIITFVVFFLPIVVYPRSGELSDTLAVVTFVQGKVVLQRDQKAHPIRPNTFLYRYDRVISEDGKADIQIGPHTIVRLSPGSVLDFTEITEDKDKRRILLELQTGALYSKIVKKKEKDFLYQVKTPTTTAGVRGTEFIVAEEREERFKKLEDGDIPPGVFVNRGEVSVEVARDNKPMAVILREGEQLLTRTAEIRKQILDEAMKKKMDIFARLQLLTEENYEKLKKQRDRDLQNLRRIKERQQSDLERMRGK
ncbi:MAG: FecR family protein [Leptospiraceae bacterium]|nr:FecR family protein [Leptospiraceae bacterium]MDW8307632.1 FecR family protein [Leptospiraceae bacterium]